LNGRRPWLFDVASSHRPIVVVVGDNDVVVVVGFVVVFAVFVGITTSAHRSATLGGSAVLFSHPYHGSVYDGNDTD